MQENLTTRHRNMFMCAVLVLATGCEAELPEAKVKKQSHVVKQSEVSRQAPVETAPPVQRDSAPAPVEVNVEPPSFSELMATAGKLASAKQTTEAIGAFQQAALRDPKNARPHIEMSVLFIGLRENALAREHAELAVKLEPEVSRCWNTLGRVELLQGKLKAAEEAFLEATKRNEKNIYAWNNLGLVRIKRGRYEGAVAALERATAGQKPQAYMFNNLGIALERLDRLEESIAAYKMGLALGSGVAGQNFVRLERKLELEETAEIIDTRDPMDPDEVVGPDEPSES